MKSECHIAAFYRFVDLEGAEGLCRRLQHRCGAHGIKGTIIVASEGVNGTVCGSAASIQELHRHLLTELSCETLEWKESVADELPFAKLKIKHKAEIISLGIDDIRPHEKTGEHVGPDRWNQLLSDPDTLVIDTRNAYEVALGTFPGAVDPNTRTFRQFPDFVKHGLPQERDRPVAMFCTGGIRCEKATAYVMDQGFDKVYQLDGGILRYLEEVEPAENRWQGECFVFDERLTVYANLAPAGHEPCANCHLPVLPEEKGLPGYEAGISCPKCAASLTPSRRRSLEERRKQYRLALERARESSDVRPV